MLCQLTGIVSLRPKRKLRTGICCSEFIWLLCFATAWSRGTSCSHLYTWVSRVSHGAVSELPTGVTPGALWDVLGAACGSSYAQGWHPHAGTCLHGYPGLFCHCSPRVSVTFPAPCAVPEGARCPSNTRLCWPHVKGRAGPGNTMRSHVQGSTTAAV